MKRYIVFLSIIIGAAMALAACSAGNQSGNASGTQFPGGTPEAFSTTSLPVITGTVAVSETLPTEAPTVVVETPTVAATNTPAAVATSVLTGTQTAGQTGTLRGAQILPPTGRTQATLLSSLLQYQVVDKNGVVIGSVQDFVINWCEAHLLDIVVLPDPALNVESGKQVLIPYEVVTLGGGSIDVNKKQIMLNLDQTQLASMPAVDVKTMDLTSADWEPQVMDYWSKYVHLSLRSDCMVSSPFDNGNATGMMTGTLTSTITSTTGTTSTMPAQNNQTSIIKAGLATNLLNAEVQTGNGQVTFGKVEDIVLQPESGLLQFAAVRMSASAQASQSLILVPIRALNIKFAEGQVNGAVTVVLLVDQSILENAPSINAISEVETANGRAAAFQYWKQYVPLNENVSH